MKNEPVPRPDQSRSPNNPYQSPQQAADQLNRALGGGMLYRGLVLIVLATLLFGLGGALVGLGLGALAPDYYRAVFDLPPDRSVWQIGLGLGFTQGLLAGLAVGCVVLLASAWYRSRIRQGLLEQLQQHSD